MTADITRMPVLKRAGQRPFPPRVSAFTRPFWDALSDGRLITTCCAVCQRLSFPPKPVCRECWSQEFTWRTLDPRGTLYSYTRVHVVPRAFVADGLYDIGIVDLVDGLRMMCRLIGDVSQFAPDAAVDMITLAYDDGPLFAARPAS